MKKPLVFAFYHRTQRKKFSWFYTLRIEIIKLNNAKRRLNSRIYFVYEITTAVENKYRVRDRFPYNNRKIVNVSTAFRLLFCVLLYATFDVNGKRSTDECKSRNKILLLLVILKRFVCFFLFIYILLCFLINSLSTSPSPWLLNIKLLCRFSRKKKTSVTLMPRGKKILRNFFFASISYSASNKFIFSDAIFVVQKN